MYFCEIDDHLKYQDDDYYNKDFEHKKAAEK